MSAEEPNDEVWFDTSRVSRDDLDRLRAQFIGGGRLDGVVLEFGIDVIPKEIMARVQYPGLSEPAVERYILRNATPDIGFENEAYFVYSPMKSK